MTSRRSVAATTAGTDATNGSSGSNNNGPTALPVSPMPRSRVNSRDAAHLTMTPRPQQQQQQQQQPLHHRPAAHRLRISPSGGSSSSYSPSTGHYSPPSGQRQNQNQQRISPRTPSSQSSRSSNTSSSYLRYSPGAAAATGNGISPTLATPRRRGGYGVGVGSDMIGRTASTSPSSPSYAAASSYAADAEAEASYLEVPSLTHRDLAFAVSHGGNGEEEYYEIVNNGNYGYGNGNGMALSFGTSRLGHRSFDSTNSGGGGSGGGHHTQGHVTATSGSSSHGGHGASTSTSAAGDSRGRVCSRKRTRRRAAACTAVVGLIGAQYVYAMQVAGKNDTTATAGGIVAVVSDAVNEFVSGKGANGKSFLADMLGVGGVGVGGSNGDGTGDDRGYRGDASSNEMQRLEKREEDEEQKDQIRRQQQPQHHRREDGQRRPRILYVYSNKDKRRKKNEKDGKGRPSTRDGSSPPLIDLIRSVGRQQRRYRSRNSNATRAHALYKRRRRVETYPPELSDETQLYPVIDSSDYPYNDTMLVRSFPPQKGDYFVGEEKTVGVGCRPMAEWQTTFYPTCNEFHGIDAGSAIRDSSLSYLGAGHWRDAWSLLPPITFLDGVNTTRVDNKKEGGNKKLNAHDSPVVYKTWSYAHRFENFYYELNRVDAVVMERLTSSPYVINIYGLCGLSIITQHAAETLTVVADKLDMIDKLKLIRKIAEGLSHIHGIGGSQRASLVHNDLNTAHIMMAEDGETPLLNDFNVAQLMLSDDSKKSCGFASEHWSPQWRSPEEIQSYHALDHEKLTERVDIYALGNVIYRFLTGKRAWWLGPGSMTKKYQNDIAKWKREEGKTPTVPDSVLDQKGDKPTATLLDIMEQCFKYKPNDRPRARDIVRLIDKVLAEVERG